MSGIADSIRISQNTEEMLRRALERIVQLYTDKSHFVYELLQNAEDAGATCIRFTQFPDRLIVCHDGKPFTSANLQGLCDIGKSDKVGNLNQIGEFGVGFKSVFGICETVLLYSDPNHYRGEDIGDAIPFAVQVNDFTRPEDIAPVPIDHAYTTQFVFPYAVGRTFSGFDSVEKLNKVLSGKLRDLGITTLLFMKHLSVIEYEIRTDATPVKGSYMLEKQSLNDHSALVTALGSSSINNKEKGDKLLSFLMFSKTIDELSERTVDIAFPVTVSEEGKYTFSPAKKYPYVSVYFPTETESKLDFIVQGPYRTTPNRSSIPAEDADNIKLAKLTAQLLRSVLFELRDTGVLDLSCMRCLPLDEARFSTYNLFLPLHEMVKNVFSSNKVIPTRSGTYVGAAFAKIARQEKLANLIDDKLLSDLIHDGKKYYWLPTSLTETNREYETVFRFLTGFLKINQFRPEDIRLYLPSNPGFLPARDDNWLSGMYSILENVPNAFSRNRPEATMLLSPIVRTMKGEFVAPYRRTEGKQFVPNVFLFHSKLKNTEINFVDPELYKRSRHFFDNVLQLEKPNEYEFYLQDLHRRYSQEYVFKEKTYISEVNALLKCMRNEEYKEEAEAFLRNEFFVRCNDGEMRNPISFNVYLPASEDNLNFEAYFSNVMSQVYFLDVDLYRRNNLDFVDIALLGVRTTILTGTTITRGTYDTGSRGRQPEWYTPDQFRWKLNLVGINYVLKYISANPNAKDSLMKSSIIMRILQKNAEKLHGSVRLSGSRSDLENETSDLVRYLRGEMFYGWDGRWVYTESLELVSPKSVTKYDLSSSLYGKVYPDPDFYELLGFRRSESDELDTLKKNITRTQMNALLEEELRARYGITLDDIDAKFGRASTREDVIDYEVPQLEFPVGKIKNIDALKKHAAEMLMYSNPVTYAPVLRSIRVSNRPAEARAYLMNLYRYEGTYRYACQLCHEAVSDFKATQIFDNPENELDPFHLCLCPNCQAEYRRLRSNDTAMRTFRNAIVSKKDADIMSDDHISVPLSDHEVWFTQIHFAEVKELLVLNHEVLRQAAKPVDPAPSALPQKTKQSSKDSSSSKQPSQDPTTNVFWRDLIGQNIRHKQGRFSGVITKIDNQSIYVDVKRGFRSGEQIRIELKYVIGKKAMYEIYKDK